MKRRDVLAVLLILLALGAGAWWFVRPDLGSMQIEASAVARSSAEQIERGRYLVVAGNCIGCHTAQGGAPYSGGRRMPTPFGAIYSTNLTSDPDTGLGHWSAQDFWRALHYGRSRNGRRLYPAFPYPNYTRVTREDADAMFAFLQSLPPVRKKPIPHELRFPYSTQLALRVWRALYFRPGEYQADPERSPEWNRGAYLVEGLGHCNACHTQRNWLGASEASEEYAGGPIPMLGWNALPLTSLEPMSDNEAAEMVELLQAGTSRSGVTSGPMAEVVFHSLQHLHEGDIRAMVSYIRSLPHHAPPEVARLRVPQEAARELEQLGGEVYGEHCAQCHGDDGQGQPYVYPALAGNRSVTSPSPRNALQAVLFGGYAPSTTRHPRPYGMPPYAHRLSDEEIAAVLTYIRRSWGNRATAVSPIEVRRR